MAAVLKRQHTGVDTWKRYDENAFVDENIFYFFWASENELIWTRHELGHSDSLTEEFPDPV